MANKNNIRSIRFSDELAELIDRQVGRTFTEKFENLITRCVWELPQKEKELERIQTEIDQKKKQFYDMSRKAADTRAMLEDLQNKTKILQYAIDRYISQIES